MSRDEPSCPPAVDIPGDSTVAGRTFWSSDAGRDLPLRAFVSLGRLYYGHALVTAADVERIHRPIDPRSIGQLLIECERTDVAEAELGAAAEEVGRRQRELLTEYYGLRRLHSAASDFSLAPKCFSLLHFEHGDATGDNRPRCGTTTPHLHVLTVNHSSSDEQQRLEQALLAFLRPEDGWIEFGQASPLVRFAEERQEYLAIGIGRRSSDREDAGQEPAVYWWGLRVPRSGLPRTQQLRWLVWSALLNAGRSAPETWLWSKINDSLAAADEAKALRVLTEHGSRVPAGVMN